MYGRNRLRREPHVVFKISYVKLTALYVRASDGGDLAYSMTLLYFRVA